MADPTDHSKWASRKFAIAAWYTLFGTIALFTDKMSGLEWAGLGSTCCVAYHWANSRAAAH